MKGYFRFDSNFLDTKYTIEGFIGLEAMLQYCEDESITFDELMVKFTGVNSESPDIASLLRLIKKLTYYGYQNLCEMNDVGVEFSEKKLRLIIDNADLGIAEFIEMIVNAFMEAMPKVDEKNVAKKKLKASL